MGKSTIYTIGYEKREMNELVAEVERLDAMVVDVRMRPFSRWTDWTNTRLESILGERYRWVEGFGNENYKGGPIELHDPEEGFEQIADLIEQGRNVILLCLEADPTQCHRSHVADLIVERFGCPIKHLIPGGTQLELL